MQLYDDSQVSRLPVPHLWGTFPRTRTAVALQDFLKEPIVGIPYETMTASGRPTCRGGEAEAAGAGHGALPLQLQQGGCGRQPLFRPLVGAGAGAGRAPCWR